MQPLRVPVVNAQGKQVGYADNIAVNGDAVTATINITDPAAADRVPSGTYAVCAFASLPPLTLSTKETDVTNYLYADMCPCPEPKSPDIHVAGEPSDVICLLSPLVGAVTPCASTSTPWWAV